MKVNLDNIQDNKLFHRKDVHFSIEHDGKNTPNRQQVKELLAAELGSTPGKVIVAKITTTYGRALSSGIARVYQSAEEAQKHELKFLLKRNEKKGDA